MAQALKDVPRKRSEYWRQKGPTPLIAYVMVALLLAALLAFFGPPLVDRVTGGDGTGSSNALSRPVE